jgi:hypothetical protein
MKKGDHFTASGWPIPGETSHWTVLGEVNPSPNPHTIICLPTPCKGGFEYVPDWWGITHFG